MGLKIMKNKKAISPVIATVILLAIAIGLGVVAMNWGRAYLEISSTCAIDTKMKIVSVNNIPQICYQAGEDGFIQFLIENGPNTDIEKLQLRAIGNRQVYSTEVESSSIVKGGSYLGMVPYNTNIFGDIKQIKITPELLVYENQPPAICTEQGIIIENIGQCK